VDEKILAVFTVDSNGNTSDLFIAPDAKIDRSFIETLRLNLDLKFKTTIIEKAAATAVIEEPEAEQGKQRSNTLGKHILDISEYDKIRVIRIHEANRLIVVLAKSHTPLGDTADTVLGYVYECNEEKGEEEGEKQQEEDPPCLF
jgi:hypothetical protein